MRILSILNELVSLAETRGQKDIVNLVLELERELIFLLDKLSHLRAVIEDILECSHSASNKALTKIELDLISYIKDSGKRCIDLDELKERAREYSTQTLILALRQLKRARLIDIELDVSGDGLVKINICRKLT